ncbi:predicted protein [Chaetoceros tenuissimus]|uniref:MYND-type domain-containing protein n=1 Tax=Chaetoceros tenuissimus TaxID=426638 RepID=A0AAD3H7Y7_9STRA|nr:predicted protein [Chaetoceros tenuissimus]
MGKKSKRRGGNRSQTSHQTRTRGISTVNTRDEFQQIERAVKSLFEDSYAMICKALLFSQGRVKLSKIISLLEANKDMLVKNHPDYYRTTNICAYEKIANLEVRRRNFQAVIPIYKFCDSIVIESHVLMTDKLYLLFCLALMVTGKKDSYLATEAALKNVHDIHSVDELDPSKPHLHSIKAHLASLGPHWHMFLVELRRTKKWDEALDLTNKFGRYIEESKYCGLSFMLAVTYLERYRVEARKRPKDERNKMTASLYKYIFSKINESCEKEETDEVFQQPFMILVLAQWAYLNHHGSGELGLSCKDAAIDLVLQYMEALYAQNAAMMSCIGCLQKSTTADPLLVCSGCRAVCYCCIDHQRSSWEKELDMGVGIGHKMLCPLHKAFRKMKLAYEGNKGNVDGYVARFQNECERFLSDNLGLKDLCFPQEFVDEHGMQSMHHNAKW